MKKKGGTWRTIKSSLAGIAVLVAIWIAIEYLSSIQLIWFAIIILVVFISKAENRISNITTKLGYIEDEKRTCLDQ
jgi:hypothetical protein